MQKEVVDQWFSEGGDAKYLLGHDLNEDSIVFDIGGYKGEFAQDIHDKFKCTVYVFEPIKEFYDIIDTKFANNDKVKTFNFGISDSTRQETFYLNDDGTSAYTGKGDGIIAELKNIVEFLDENNIDKVDLVKINIEGEEYPLLKHFISNDLVGIFDNIQIQFHDFIHNAESDRNFIRESLDKSHSLTYDYPFVWENWKIN